MYTFVLILILEPRPLTLLKHDVREIASAIRCRTNAPHFWLVEMGGNRTLEFGKRLTDKSGTSSRYALRGIAFDVPA